MIETPSAAFLPVKRAGSTSDGDPVFERIARDLFGTPATRSPSFQLTLGGEGLQFSARVANSPPNHDESLKAGAFHEGLWLRDVAELFLRDPGSDRYVEVNLSPTGAWWAMSFDGKLQRLRQTPSPPFTPHCSSRNHGGYRESSVNIPLDWLQRTIGFEPATTTGNVTFILDDAGGGRQFLSWCKLRSPTPDFHTTEDFPPLSLS